MMSCKICGNSTNNKTYIAEERMFGFKDKFEYMECSACNCVQLINIPANLEKYYPKDGYYSFHNDGNFKESRYSLANFFRRIKSDYLLFGKHQLLGSLLSIGYTVPGYYLWLKKIKANYDTSILDLGCGGGQLLFRLRRLGFSNLTGADPFIEKDIHENGVTIYKKEVYELSGTYDFIMVNHAFEHMEYPLAVLKKLYELLKPKHYLLLRIPVSDSYCWHHYGVYWSALDAPRHLYIHSAKSIRMLCDQSGFEIKEILHDTTAFHFWGSEQYIKDIPLVAENSYEKNKRKSIFSKKQIKGYKKRIEELNNQQLGGDAVFYLYKN
jgi:SAM-dependent methyltransferase